MAEVSELPSRAGRVMALDFGKRRVGLAVSDELGLTAQGIETLQRTRIRDDLDALAETAARYGVTLFLMGLPLHMCAACALSSPLM